MSTFLVDEGETLEEGRRASKGVSRRPRAYSRLLVHPLWEMAAWPNTDNGNGAQVAIEERYLVPAT